MKKLIILCCVMQILIIGCGKNQNTDIHTLVPVTLQLKSGVDAQSAGYYMALNKGFYYDEGLDVNFQTGDLQSQIEELVLSGQVSFGVSWLPRLMVYYDQKKSLVHLAQIVQRSGTKYVFRKSSGITHPIELINHRASLWPAGNNHEFILFMNQYGVNEKNVILSEEKEPLQSLNENKCDLAALSAYKSYIDYTSSLSLPTDLIVFDGSTESWGLPQDCIFTSEKIYKENPVLCKKFTRATIKGWEYVLANQKETISVLQNFDKTNMLNPDIEFKRLREFVKLIPQGEAGNLNIGKLSDHDFQHANELMVTYGLIKQFIPKDQFLKN